MNNFWIVKRNGIEFYVKRISTHEEIISKFMDKGVEIQYKQNKNHFTNLIDLKDYLEWILYTHAYNQSSDFPPYF